MIRNNASYSVVYGGGIDIIIYDNSNTNKNSYSIAGGSYGKNEGMTERSLTKEREFTVKEIEVY